MRLEFDKNGYVCCVLYGCSTGTCVEYTGTVPTQPEEYTSIDDWANRAQTNAYYLDDDGNLAYDSNKATTPEAEPTANYSTSESNTGIMWIDGRYIYKVTVIFEAGAKSASLTADTGIDGGTVDVIVKTEGTFATTTAGDWSTDASYSHATSLNYQISSYISNVGVSGSNMTVNARNGSSRATYGGYVTVFYVKPWPLVNLFNVNSADNVTGSFINRNGTVYSASGYVISHAIAVEAGATYYITPNSDFSGDYYCCYYDSSDTVVTSTAPTATSSSNWYVSTAPAGSAYMKISTTTNLMATAMVIKATKEPASAYVPYVE